MLRIFLPGLAHGPVGDPDSPRRLMHSIAVAAMESIDMVHRCIARNRQRQALRDLDDRLLSDIGISRGAATREARRWL